jgi:hypothetical protein
MLKLKNNQHKDKNNKRCHQPLQLTLTWTSNKHQNIEIQWQVFIWCRKQSINTSRPKYGADNLIKTEVNLKTWSTIALNKIEKYKHENPCEDSSKVD